jgi:hypothetical protein
LKLLPKRSDVALANTDAGEMDPFVWEKKAEISASAMQKWRRSVNFAPFMQAKKRREGLTFAPAQEPLARWESRQPAED